MKVKLFSAAAVLLGAVALSGPAMADCVYPKTPGSAPNGSTATQDEMIAGKLAFEQYQKDVNAYLECLDADANKSVKALGDKPENAEQVKQIKIMATKRHNAAIDELQARATEFNSQLHAYKDKHKS